MYFLLIKIENNIELQVTKYWFLQKIKDLIVQENINTIPLLH